MREQFLDVGNATITVSSHDFLDGYHRGLSWYYEHYHGKPLADTELRTFIVESCSNERASEAWNTGFIFGWMTALHEKATDIDTYEVVDCTTQLQEA